VGRLGADIPVQRGVAHSTLHKPIDPGRAYDCVFVQSHQDVAARRPILGAARGGKLYFVMLYVGTRTSVGGRGVSFFFSNCPLSLKKKMICLLYNKGIETNSDQL